MINKIVRPLHGQPIKLLKQNVKTMCSKKSNFTHDCDACVSLGSFEYTGTENYPTKYDLYYCPAELFGPTVVARYGDFGPEYFSYIGRTATNPAILEAVRRVDANGWELR